MIAATPPPIIWHHDCAVKVTWSVEGMRGKDKKAAKFAIRKIRKATGLKFRKIDSYAGAKISIQYHKGLGGSLAQGGYQGGYKATAAIISWGFVNVNKQTTRWLPRTSRRSLFMHEIGHAIGMTHQGDINNVMWPVDNRLTRWGNQDKRQLRQRTCSTRRT